MNESTQELATLYVLDKLTVEERKAFEKRLESETQLVMLVRELETAVEEQIRALPQESPPDNLYSRIESLTQPHEPAPLAKSTLSISWPVLAGWGMAAALLLGVGLTLLITDRDLEGPQGVRPVYLVVGMDSDSSSFKTIPAAFSEGELGSFGDLTQMVENYWDHPDELPSKPGYSPLANTRGSGFAVFDPQSKYGYIAIQNLPKQKEGKNYFLWLKDPQADVLECAGIIPMQDRTQGLYFFELDDNSPISSSRVTFFVTEETASEPKLTKPVGEMVLGSDRI